MVGEAIASVLAQTLRDFALVVVDDGSSDDSAYAAARALATTPARVACSSSATGTRASDPEHPTARGDGVAVPTRILRTPWRGVAAARNTGATAIDSRWIAFLDSDDLWMPRKLERQMAWLAARPAYRMAQTEERWIDRGRHRNARAWHRKEERLFARSLERCLVSPSAVVIRRDLWNESGGFDESFPLCEDYELWLRLTLGEPVGLIPEALVVKRGGHPDQLSRSTWGLDRFRVAALVKLLAGVWLDDAARSATVRVLHAKCGLLAAGAARRGRHAEAERYRRLANWGTEIARAAAGVFAMGAGGARRADGISTTTCGHDACAGSNGCASGV